MSFFSKTTKLDTLIPGQVAISFKSTQLSEQDSKLLPSPKIGMVVLFKENFENEAQLTRLIKSIRAIRSDILIAVDHEGAIWRFNSSAFPKIQTAREIAVLYQEDEQKGLAAAFSAGAQMAKPLCAHDIDISFAPVLDCHHPESQIIGKLGRAFDQDPQVVLQLARAFIKGMNSQGVMAVGKHFPDHGTVKLDSHKRLPVDSRATAELQPWMQIYTTLIQEGWLKGVMMNHVAYPNAFPDAPTAGFSKNCYDYLRGQQTQEVAIFTDCLSMKAVDESKEESPLHAAAAAGADYVMKTHHANTMSDEQLLTQLESLPDSPGSILRRRNFIKECQALRSQSKAGNFLMQFVASNKNLILPLLIALIALVCGKVLLDTVSHNTPTP